MSASRYFNSHSTDSLFIHRTESLDVYYEPPRLTPKCIQSYILGDALGEGSYGKVREAFDMYSLRRAAIKIMKQKRLRKIPGGEENVRRELALLYRLSHKNIVRLYEVIHTADRQKMFIVMEYCHTSLQSLLDRSPDMRLPLSQSWRYFRDLVHGLAYLHSQSIAHRDIKPSNLLISSGDILKITDFGVADAFDPFTDDTCSSSAGSPAFQPPEVAGGRERFSGFKVDVWASGVTLFNMITGQYPFAGDSIYALYHSIAHDALVVPPAVPPLLADLVAKMLEKEPSERAALDDVAAHPWCLVAVAPRANEPETLLVHASTIVRTPSGYGVTTTLLPYLRYMYPDDVPQQMQDTLKSLSAHEQGREGGMSFDDDADAVADAVAAASAQSSSSVQNSPQMTAVPPSPKQLPRQLSELLKKMTLKKGGKKKKKSIPGFEEHTSASSSTSDV